MVKHCSQPKYTELNNYSVKWKKSALVLFLAKASEYIGIDPFLGK
jgi:hypothetical protein